MEDSFRKARGIVGYLRVSTIALSDFHACQKRLGLPENKIDQDVRTRWRSSHDMADDFISNKAAVLEMDKNSAYKVPRPPATLPPLLSCTLCQHSQLYLYHISDLPRLYLGYISADLRHPPGSG